MDDPVIPDDGNESDAPEQTVTNPDGTPANLSPLEQSQLAAIQAGQPPPESPPETITDGRQPVPMSAEDGKPLSFVEQAQARKAAGIVDPLLDLSPEDMVSYSRQTLEKDPANHFKILDAFSARQDEISKDPNAVSNIAKAWDLYQKSTNLGDMSVNLGQAWTMVKGLAEQSADVLGHLPALGWEEAALHVPGLSENPALEHAQNVTLRNITEAGSGTRSNFEGLVDLARNIFKNAPTPQDLPAAVAAMAEKIPGLSGLANKLRSLSTPLPRPDLANRTAQSQINSLFFDSARAKQQQDILQGGGAGTTLFQDVGLGNFAPEGTAAESLAAAGTPVRPEHVANMAAGDILGNLMFGKAFGLAGKVVPGLTSAELAAMGEDVASLGGRATTLGAQVVRAVIPKVAAVAPIAGAIKGAVAGTGTGVGTLAGISIGAATGRGFAKGLLGSIPKLTSIAEAGQQIAGRVPVTSPYAQLAKDIFQAAPTVAYEAGKGALADVALAASANTPEQAQNVGIGTLFGLAGGGFHAFGKTLSGQLIYPREYGLGTPIPNNGVFPTLEPLHDAGVQTLTKGQQDRVNGLRAVVRTLWPDSELIYVPPTKPTPAPGSPEALLAQKTGTVPAEGGVVPQTSDVVKDAVNAVYGLETPPKPEDPLVTALMGILGPDGQPAVSRQTAETWANTGGLVSQDVGDKHLVLIRNLETAPHEAVGHVMEAALGESVMQDIDKMIQTDPKFQGQTWDAIASDYASRFAGANGQRLWNPTQMPWQDFLLSVSGWGLRAAKEKLARQQIGEGPITPAQSDAIWNGQQEFTGNHWQDVLTPQEQTTLANRYISRELFADGMGAAFEHGTTAHPELVSKIARYVGSFYRFLGGDPLAGRYARGSQYPLSYDLTKTQQGLLQSKLFGAPLPPEVATGTRQSLGAFGGIPTTPEQQKEAAAKATEHATQAPDVAPVVGGQSPRSVLGVAAESMARGAGNAVHIEGYGSAPGDPSSAIGAKANERARIVQAWRSMPESAKGLVPRLVYPTKTVKTKAGDYQVEAWNPEVLFANAQRTVETVNQLNTTGHQVALPTGMEIDPATGSFTVASWRLLSDSIQKFAANQRAGLTGSGEPVNYPPEVLASKLFKPAVTGEGASVPQDMADFINYLYNIGLPKTPIIRGETVPMNLQGQRIAEATMPERPIVEPAYGGGEFGTYGKTPETRAAQAELAKTLGITGERIQEVNPFRAQLEGAVKSAGINKPDLFSSIQHFNVKSIRKIEHAPEQGPNIQGVYPTLAAGFEPTMSREASAQYAPKPTREVEEALRDASPIVKDEAGLPKPFYHGTAYSDELLESGGFSKEKMDPHALYGPGIYLTESPEIAGGVESATGDWLRGYATGKGSGGASGVIPAFVNLKNPFDINKSYSPEEIQQTFGKYLPKVPDTGRPEVPAHLAADLSEAVERVDENVSDWDAEDNQEERANWLEGLRQDEIFNRRHPEFGGYDLDLHDTPYPPEVQNFLDWAFDNREDLKNQLSGYTGEAMSGHDIYKALQNTLGNKVKVNSTLQQLGFDGITHKGGGFWTGSGFEQTQGHQVVIPFSPDQVFDMGGKSMAAPAIPSRVTALTRESLQGLTAKQLDRMWYEARDAEVNASNNSREMYGPVPAKERVQLQRDLPILQANRDLLRDLTGEAWQREHDQSRGLQATQFSPTPVEAIPWEKENTALERKLDTAWFLYDSAFRDLKSHPQERRDAGLTEGANSADYIGEDARNRSRFPEELQTLARAAEEAGRNLNNHQANRPAGAKTAAEILKAANEYEKNAAARRAAYGPPTTSQYEPGRREEGKRGPVYYSQLANVVDHAQFQPSQRIREFVDHINKTSPDEWSDWAHTVPTGMSAVAHDTGMTAQTPEDLALLRSTANQYSELARHALTADKWDLAGILANKSQAAREAFESATGTTLDGKGNILKTLQQLRPGYKPPMPPAGEPETPPTEEPAAQAQPKTYIVRHGSTGMNNADPTKDKIRGFQNPALSEAGKQEVADTANKLAGSDVTTVITSDLKRARQTADAIAKTTGAKVVEEPGLRPWHFGNTIEGKPTSDMLPVISNLVENPDQKPPGGESFNEFKDRYLATFHKAQDEYPDENTALVTHYRGTKLLEAWRATGTDNDELDRELFEEYSQDRKPGSYDVIDKTGAEIGPEAAQFAPKDKEWKLKEARGGGAYAYSKAWITPEGKPVTLGSTLHHEWLNANPDVRKRYGIPEAKEAGPIGATEANLAALNKGFARMNYAVSSGKLTVEASNRHWPDLVPSVRRFVQANAGKIDSMEVHLLDKTGKEADSGFEPLFRYSDREKMDHLPLISAPPETTEMSPQASSAQFDPGREEKQATYKTSGLAFKDFFSQATRGETGKSAVPWSPIMDLERQSDFVKEQAKHTGNFDEHIAKSIPGFKETQIKTGAAIVKTFGRGADMLDIAASEGSYAKTISALSDGKIETVSLDPNPDMAKFFETKSQVPGATYDTSAFLHGFEDAGVRVPAYDPSHRFDVVHESMGFQFISNERAAQISEAKRLMNPNGVFLTEEKVLTPDWKANEAKKDSDYKSQYFSPEDLAVKNKTVGFQQSDQETQRVGMVDNMVSDNTLESVLKDNFKHVVQYWDSGNFRGYAASDSRAVLSRLVANIGDLNTDFSTRETPVGVTSEAQFAPKRDRHAFGAFDEEGDLQAALNPSGEYRSRLASGVSGENPWHYNAKTKTVKWQGALPEGEKQDAVSAWLKERGYPVEDQRTTRAQFAPFQSPEFGKELDKIRKGESGGATFTTEGTLRPRPDKPVDYVSLVSTNVKQADLNRETMEKALAPYADLLAEPGINAGLYAFSKDGIPTVSIDVNAEVPQEYRKNTLDFAKQNDQRSIWDPMTGDYGEEVMAGGKGNTRLKTLGEVYDALKPLQAGEPVDVQDIKIKHARGTEIAKTEARQRAGAKQPEQLGLEAIEPRPTR